MIIETRRGYHPAPRNRRRPRRRSLWFVYVGPHTGCVAWQFRTAGRAVAFALAQAGERVLERHTFHKGRRDLTIWRLGADHG